jgi:hypothetical protein
VTGAPDGNGSTVTLLSDPPPGAPGATTTVPTRTAAPRTGAARPLPTASPLRRAVVAAIIRLDDVDGTDGAITTPTRRRIDQVLRDAVDRHLERVGDDPPEGAVAAVPAVRVACAHLAAGDLEDAYLALLTARDLLR